ncbi:MAG: winged helix-turn-helix domain-containing protein [Clostridia bacterium]|nr:winged helix-turn-helix domain-containing protein [Clostridia bacterium]MBO5756037.1 winged helix-turn-helix domain-containing protein [Clostridia bacterium]MBO7170241.1 winged helix-turn-helix domain-containing protein [Clostridia bacterium]
MRLCLISADEELRHRFSLLPEEHTFTDVAHAELVVWDADSAPRPVTSLPVLCVTREKSKAEKGDLLLLRPFSLHAPELLLKEIAPSHRLPHLSPTEQRLLTLLREAGEAGMDRETLSHAVFGEKADRGLLNVYICYLRKKLESDGKKRIFALRGKGYVYRADHTDR